jgi:hypothetical protein
MNNMNNPHEEGELTPHSPTGKCGCSAAVRRLQRSSPSRGIDAGTDGCTRTSEPLST